MFVVYAGALSHTRPLPTGLSLVSLVSFVLKAVCAAGSRLTAPRQPDYCSHNGQIVPRVTSTAFVAARRGLPREINRQIVLNLVRARQPLSRADLARLMATRRGAVSLL